jgi:hypothetical protein
MRNPLTSEEAAFGFLVRVVLAVALVVVLVLLIRAVT